MANLTDRPGLATGSFGFAADGGLLSSSSDFSSDSRPPAADFGGPNFVGSAGLAGDFFTRSGGATFFVTAFASSSSDGLSSSASGGFGAGGFAAFETGFPASSADGACKDPSFGLTGLDSSFFSTGGISFTFNGGSGFSLGI